ncbi:TRAP transporter small permease [Marinobacter zhejiangensis]|uniref:TRAP transporter small permease protein n=1 Tax=Marinobacter zhejiangensis TaxID=488535 RepID=A0A1I4NT36_9GAMM|nr:TRAP transporter small permease [Marinobacter zhejiangensis]SFM18661.1 TRAP-type C4-dicarboxylate transport system, small permease component [Marinobacter zhejiangensis]
MTFSSETVNEGVAVRKPSRTHGALQRLVGSVDAATYWVIVVVMALMVLVVSLQVFWRYVLGSSIDSADELSRLLFVWAIFLAIPHGIKQGVHMGIDLFVSLMPAAVKAVLFRVMAAFSAVLMLAVVVGAWVATVDRWPELMPTLPVTSAVYYIALLICGVHSFLHLVLLTWNGENVGEEAS